MPRVSKDPVVDDRNEVSALARGLQILHTVAQNGPLSVGDICAASGIPKPTVSRLVATLLASGYLRQEPGSLLCRLGPAFLMTGNAYLADLDVRAMLRPHLLDLADLAGAKVNVGVRSGLEIVVVDSIRPKASVILSYVEIGARMGLAHSAAGRAYLAAMDEDEREQALLDLRAATTSGWRSVAARLRDAAAQFAAVGYCASYGDWHPEINALGTVVKGPGNERFALSCGGPTYRLTPQFLEEVVAPALVKVGTGLVL